MKKIDEEGNCTFEYLNYMNSLDKKDLMNFAIGADLLVDRLNNIINKAIEYIESYMPNYDFDKTNLTKVLDILKGVAIWHTGMGKIYKILNESRNE